MDPRRMDASECGWGRFLALCGFTLVLSSSVFAEGLADGWSTNFETALKDAKASNRPILVAVTAVWCGPCRQMKQLTLAEESVQRVLQANYVSVSIDGDQRADLVSRLGVTAYPTTLVLNPDGSVRQRWVGFQSAGEFRRELEGLANVASSDRSDSQLSDDEFPPVSAIFPSNASPFEFGGFCLVSLLDENKLRRGADHYYAWHRSVRVCFYSAEHRDRFLANPDRYWPAANGNCLVTSREQRQEQRGDPRVGVLWQNRLWFFADRDRQRKFMQSPKRFLQGL